MRSLLVVLWLIVAVPVGAAGTAAASTPSSAADLPDGCAGSALTKPDCGVEPTAPGDRGGSSQLILAAVVLAGMGTIFTVVVRAALRSSRPVPTGPAVGADDTGGLR